MPPVDDAGDGLAAADESTATRFMALKIKLALDVAQGMAFMHSHGIIHRDLKLGNVLLTHGNSTAAANAYNRSGLKAKVADFGTSALCWRVL